MSEVRVLSTWTADTSTPSRAMILTEVSHILLTVPGHVLFYLSALERTGSEMGDHWESQTGFKRNDPDSGLPIRNRTRGGTYKWG